MIVALALVAGGAGAVARYGLSGYVQRWLRSTRPWGTAAVNLAGSLALGILVGLSDGAVLSGNTAVVAGTGFLGGFTTFSTWALESVNLLETGGRSGVRSGAVNVLGQLGAGVAAAGIGVLIVHWM